MQLNYEGRPSEQDWTCESDLGPPQGDRNHNYVDARPPRNTGGGATGIDLAQDRLWENGRIARSNTAGGRRNAICP